MADEGEIQYFAYGSNMSTAHTVAHCPSARAVTTATLLNYELGFGRLSTGPLFVGGISTVSPEAGGTVEGVLFRVQRHELEAWDSDYAEKNTNRDGELFRALNFELCGRQDRRISDHLREMGRKLHNCVHHTNNIIVAFATLLQYKHQ